MVGLDKSIAELSRFKLAFQRREKNKRCEASNGGSKLTESSFFLIFFYIGDAGNTPLVADGTSLGRDHSRYLPVFWPGPERQKDHCKPNFVSDDVSCFSVDMLDVSLRTEVPPCPVVSSLSQASCGGQLSVS